MSSALCRVASAGSRRVQPPRMIKNLGVAGGRGMAFKTNPYVEEWMGKREITEKTFTYTKSISFGLVMTIVVVPLILYGNIKSEMEAKDVKLDRKREYL